MLSKSLVFDAIRLHTFSEEGLAEYIRSCGVDFQLTPEETGRVRTLGAGDLVLKAIHDAYQPPPSPELTVTRLTERFQEPIKAAKVPVLVHVAGEVQQARLIKTVPLEQPDEARVSRLQLERADGPVRLELTISEAGEVIGTKRINGHPVLAEIASEAVKQWRYLPAVEDGRHVAVVTEVDLSFRAPTLLAARPDSAARARSAPSDLVPRDPAPPDTAPNEEAAPAPPSMPSEPVHYTVAGDAAELLVAPLSAFAFSKEVLRAPDRLVLDFTGGEAMVGGKVPRSIQVGDMFVKQIRVGVPRPNVTRVVIELQPDVVHRVVPGQENVRVTINSRASGEQARRRSVEPPRGTPLLPLEPEATQRRKVILDAGHGGRDTGAVGSGGLTEKDVALDICLRLRAMLQTAGITTAMTRFDDSSVSLEERARLVRATRPGLFLSVHANSEPSGMLTGFQTFIAERPEPGSPVQTYRDSRSLAAYVHAALQLTHPSGERTPVKPAQFTVLADADVPSALAEVGFLSNREEESLLAQPSYREQLAAALSQAVQKYLASRDRLTVMRY